MPELTALGVTAAGLAVALAGFLWLAAAAWRVRRAWGAAVLLLPPVGPLLFALAHRRPAAGPLAVVLLGLAAAAGPPVYNRFAPAAAIDLGPRDAVVDGERHLTLTGWDRTDYGRAIAARPDVAVLQMANADVTDATLESLRGLAALHELDISHTSVTDAGLAVLATLPRLKSLRLAGTAVTAAGFRDRVAPLPALERLDLSDTAVPAAELRKWRNADPARRAYVR